MPVAPQAALAAVPDTIEDGNAVLATVHQLPKPETEQTLTDYGNAQVLVERCGHVIKYTPSGGSWLTWNGAHWKMQEDDGPVTEMTWETIVGIDDKGRDNVKTHKHRSLSRRGIEAAVAIARRDSRIRVQMDQLDAHPYDLNTPSGIVDLRTGKLGPHEAAKLHTKLTAAPYNPAAECPQWEQFLRTTFNGDEEMIRYVQRLVGYSATGKVTKHVFPFLFGSGGNGKSLFLEVIVAVMGDYATTAPSGFLMAGRSAHETEIARLHGARIVACSETNKGDKFDEGKVKLLTGGDRLTARFMRENHFTFVPSHTLWGTGNYQPAVEAGGDSFWRRLRLLGFTHKVPDHAKVEDLGDRIIREEAAGVLRWIIEGAAAFLTEGMKEPASVLAATASYAEEEDALSQFVGEKCVTGLPENVRIVTSKLRAEYGSWCREQGVKEVSAQQFGRDLKARLGVDQIKSNGVRYYVGLTLKGPAFDPDHWSNR
jgi:P4 family phage/plasmid primase-like protien